MTTTPEEPRAAAAPGRDLLLVGFVTLSVAGLAVAFDLHEALFGYTRRWEWLQVDELPTVLLTLSACLIWLSWRRYREARTELLARREAESRLHAVLAENRELAQQQLVIQEAERRRLARELHDELGQYLNAIKLDAVSILAAGASPAQVAEAGRGIIHSVDHVHAAVGDMIRRLRPAGLDELGLAAALEACVDHWRHRLPATGFSLVLNGELENLGETLNLTIYRLIQESLTNVFKHSQATQIEVFLERLDAHTDRDRIELDVTDNGRGAAADALRGGFGIGGMRERVALLGGEFHIETAPGQGFRLSVRLPRAGARREQA